jgi:hypothetical protein
MLTQPIPVAAPEHAERFEIYHINARSIGTVHWESRGVSEALWFAQDSAAKNVDGLWRVFAITDSNGGRRFVTAFTSEQGIVAEHPSPTIPRVHWRD